MVLSEQPPLRKIGLREFNRNFYKQLKDVPFILTKDKKPYMIVLPYNPHYPFPDHPVINKANETSLHEDPGIPPQVLTLWQRIKKTLTKNIA